MIKIKKKKENLVKWKGGGHEILLLLPFEIWNTGVQVVEKEKSRMSLFSGRLLLRPGCYIYYHNIFLVFIFSYTQAQYLCIHSYTSSYTHAYKDIHTHKLSAAQALESG